MSKYHRPRSGQVATFTLTPSALCPDMRDVASATLKLKWEGSDPVTLTADLGTKAQASLPVTHTWDETAGEAQRTGNYRLWAEGTRTGGVVVQSEPIAFEIVGDSATITT